MVEEKLVLTPGRNQDFELQVSQIEWVNTNERADEQSWLKY